MWAAMFRRISRMWTAGWIGGAAHQHAVTSLDKFPADG